MKRKSSTWAWREGEVDPQKEHIELRYGNAADTPYEKWDPVSLIGKPENNIFPVKWLMDPLIQAQRDIVNKARRELDLYLLEVGGPDP